MQFRTQLQHIWATAMETIGTYFNQGLKFDQGEYKWKEFFVLMSSHIAILEKSPKCPQHKDWTDERLYKELNRVINENEVIDVLSGFKLVSQHAPANASGRSKKHCLIILNTKTKTLDLEYGSDKKLDELNDKCLQEDQKENKQAVLVRVSDIKKMNKAYPNFFLDISSFITLIRQIPES